MSALSSNGDRVVPALARELAARLSVLFERDVEIVERLNDAQRRLREANERLWSGLSPDAFGLIYDDAAVAAVGSSEVAALMDGTRDDRTAVLGALGGRFTGQFTVASTSTNRRVRSAASSPWTWARSPPSSSRCCVAPASARTTRVRPTCTSSRGPAIR